MKKSNNVAIYILDENSWKESMEKLYYSGKNWPSRKGRQECKRIKKKCDFVKKENSFLKHLRIKNITYNALSDDLNERLIEKIELKSIINTLLSWLTVEHNM